VTMSQSAELNIDRIAELARLALSPEEKTLFSAQLTSILGHIEQLAKVDVSGIEPTAHAFPLKNVWAADLVEPGLTQSAALRNAPAQRDHMIVVPKVVD